MASDVPNPPRLCPLLAALGARNPQPDPRSTQAPPLRRLVPLGAALAGITILSDVSRAQDTPLPETALPTVNVQDTRERDNPGYQGGTTSVGKMPQLPRDIPQAVTIVPRQLMDDRNADTLREAVRNVPSLTFNAGEGGRIGDNISLRGYSVVGDLYLDGIRDIAQYNRETFNLEQIDILRGSASMLFGRGSTGGIINQVTKQPFLVDRYETTFTVGNYAYRRATADLNKKVGDDAAMRLNVMKTNSGSFRDGVKLDRWGIAPSVRWGIGTANEFAANYFQLGYDDVPDYGVPYLNGSPLPVPVNRFYGVANADYQRDDTRIGTVTYTHRFGRDTELRTVLRRGEYTRDLWATAPRLAAGTTSIIDTTPLTRQAQRRAGEENTVTGQTDLATKVTTGFIRHQLLVGMEYLDESARRWNWTAAANPNTTVGSPDPFVLLPANFYSSATRTANVTYQAKTMGMYMQDTAELTKHWKVVLGTRYDDFTANYQREAPQGPLTRTDRVWSWRTGLMFQPNDGASYYVAYGTSFNPSGELYSLDDRTANTPPEKNRNMEAGAKWEFADGNLSFRTAVFRTEKTNERNTDLSIPNVSLLSGRRHTDGIELEAAGRPASNWEVFGGVAFMQAMIDEASAQQAGSQGRVPINTPDYTASLWSVHRLGGGWRVGGGAEAVGTRYGNTTNTVAAPHYVRYDMLVGYEAKRHEIKLNVLNLLDQDYYEGVYQGHVIPGTRRSVQVTGRFRF